MTDNIKDWLLFVKMTSDMVTKNNCVQMTGIMKLYPTLDPL